MTKILNQDELLDLRQAAQRIPGSPCLPTVWRWCREGLRARNGQRVRLEHRRVGGKLYTSQTWLDAFFKETSDADLAHFDANLAEV